PAASASRSRAPSPLATGAWSSTPAAPTPSRRRAASWRRSPTCTTCAAAAALPDVTALVGDVGDERHRRALVTAAGDRIDALINNASILGPSPQPPLHAYPLDVLEDVMKINALAPLRLIQLALPAMPAGARIVNVTSD